MLNGSSAPRIGIPFLFPSAWPDAVDAAGGEAVPLRLPPELPRGIALAREWVADAAQVSLPHELDALLLVADEPEVLAGLLACAVRLDVPTVVVPGDGALHHALVAAGLSPRDEDPAGVVVRLARESGSRPGKLLSTFSLANALRAGVAAGGGAEVVVHLSALAREAGVAGVSQMIRVLVPETPVARRGWVRDLGASALLAHLHDALHDVATVSGSRVKRGLSQVSSAPEPEARLRFITGRNSGTQALCSIPEGVSGAAGECRVFASEEAAVAAVKAGDVGAKDLIVLSGLGARGGPGVARLDGLAEALASSGWAREATVLTDGVAPGDALGIWISAFYPEAVVGGIIGRFIDGDELEIDLNEGRIRAGVKVEEIAARKPPAARGRGRGYVARYANSALPALEGGGLE